MKTRFKFPQGFLFKLLVFIPLTFLIFFFYINLTAQTPDSSVKKDELIKTSRKLSLVRYAPVYPGCEQHDNEFYSRKCFSESIVDHFRQNFDSSVLKKTGSKTGIMRLYVSFVINKRGQSSVAYISAPNNKMKGELIRVVDGLPKMEPGKSKDNPVNVRYTVSIWMENEELSVRGS